jgi:type VI secretion system protein ImpG
LYELCLGNALGVLALTQSTRSPNYEFVPKAHIRPVGFSDDQALLPVTLRSFQGYRLLNEYFSFPQRFRFVEIAGLERAVQETAADVIELVVLLGRGDGALDGVVDASNFALFCTPAINLFQKPRLDRIHVADSTHEFHVVADRTRPLDFEIYQVTEVVGHGAGADSEQTFLPFYATYSSDNDQNRAYFTIRREPRLVPLEQRRRGTRSSYIGSEVFLALVDSAQAPFNADLRQLSIQALCTNRDLPLLMPIGLGKSDLSLNIAAPVASIRIITGPTRPAPALADGAVAWRAISHLALNYLSLVKTTPQEGAAALRELLELYAASAEISAKRQVEGIRSVKVDRVVRRLPASGPIAFGRGLEITLEVDELAFEGGSAYLLGAVLDQYFARYVSINSVTETVLRSQSRGEISRWMPHWGGRPTL